MKKILLILIPLIFATLVYANDKMELGLEVFNNKARCGACHALQAAGSKDGIGPNLDQLKPQKEILITTVANGIGVMPSFEDILTKKEIEAVAYYVFKSTNK